MSLNTRRITSFFRNGFSLIEASIVLGVVGLVIGGIWIAAAAVNESIKWRQMEDGWTIYIQAIVNNWDHQNTADITATKDINVWIGAAVPVPSGWKIRASGFPEDPYGKIPVIQITSGSKFHLGYHWQTVDPSLCRKLQRFFLLRVNKTYVNTYTQMPAACATDLSACVCDSDDGRYIGGYYLLPR